MCEKQSFYSWNVLSIFSGGLYFPVWVGTVLNEVTMDVEVHCCGVRVCVCVSLCVCVCVCTSFFLSPLTLLLFLPLSLPPPPPLFSFLLSSLFSFLFSLFLLSLFSFLLQSKMTHQYF